MVQREFRQPRAKPALTGHQKAEYAVRAQRRLKILRLAENRRNAARHFPSAKWSDASLAIPGLLPDEVSERDGGLAMQFRQKIPGGSLIGPDRFPARSAKSPCSLNREICWQRID
jgi:hypothetical protein